jgi:serine/threonine-protein kinase RsbW
LSKVGERSAALPNAAHDVRTVRLTIPAKPEYITLSRLALTGLSRVRPLPPDTLADLKLALTEACSNSVRHAYGDGEGHVGISFELSDDRLVIEVADDGAGFELEASGRRADRDDLTEGGLGIAIIRSIADEVEFDGSDNVSGSRLRFVKRL